jgi:hypothetical protein
MHSELYTDGVGEITVSGTIVRVDLFSLSPTERDVNDFPKKVFRQRLIFSAEAFANSVEVMQNAVQGLVDAGLIDRGKPTTEREVSNTRSVGSSATPNPRPPNASTDFR